MEQLLFSLKTFHRHHNSPTLLAYHEARWDFEDSLDGYYEEHDDGLMRTWVEVDIRNCYKAIGVPHKTPINPQRNELELWTARLHEGTQIAKRRDLDMLYLIPDSITAQTDS